MTGACSLAPAPNDRRFADSAWKDNAALRRLLQAYLAAARTAQTLVEDADLEWRDAQRLRCLVANLVEAASPSNNPLLNPQAGRERPMLVTPPTINKYYVLDLAPGRSMVEYLVQQSQQVFVISWRNPDARHAAWNLDTYGRAILDALDAVEAITRTDRTILTGICSGGILAALVMGHPPRPQWRPRRLAATWTGARSPRSSPGCARRT